MYKKLVEKYESLSKFEDRALDVRREWFIQDVINQYDLVEIGTLYFGNFTIDVESIYFDDEHRLMLHVSCKEMEGDIIFSSLQREKQETVAKLVFEEMKHIEEGPTLLGMMIGGHNIVYRSVHIKKLNKDVKVASNVTLTTYIKQGSRQVKNFYCYVPSEEFFKLNDQEFEQYVNKNFKNKDNGKEYK